MLAKYHPQYFKILAVTFGLIIVTVFVGIKFQSAIVDFAALLWIPLSIAVLLAFLFWGSKRFSVEGVKEKISSRESFSKIILTQALFFIFLAGLIFISLPTYFESSGNKAELINNFLVNKLVFLDVYFYLLTAFLIILFGVIANADLPKMSNALSVMFNIPIKNEVSREFFASVIDFIISLGFLLSLLVLGSIFAVIVGDFIGNYFEMNMNFTNNIRLAGVGFALVYLPFTSPFRDLMSQLSKSPFFSLSSLLFFVSIGLGVYLVIVTGLVDWLLNVTNQNPNKLILENVSNSILPEKDLFLLVLLINFFSASIMAIYFILLSNGKNLRFTLLSLLPIPIIVGGTILLFHNSISDFLALTFSPLTLRIVGILACSIALLPLTNNSLFLKGLFLILPNDLGRKKRRVKIFVKNGASFMLYVMLIWIYFNMYGVQVILTCAGVGFLIVLILSLVGFFRYLSVNVLNFKIKKESKRHV